MLSPKLVATLVLVSFSVALSAQKPPSKPKAAQKKPTAASRSAPKPAQAPPPPPDQQICTDRLVTSNAGNAALGFALSTVTTTTTRDPNDKEASDAEVQTMSMELTDLKVTSLDKALFDMPAGNDIRMAGGMPAGMPGMPDDSGEKMTATVQDGLSKAARKVTDELTKGKPAAAESKK